MPRLVEPSWGRLPCQAQSPRQSPRQLLAQLHTQLGQAPMYGILPHQTGHTLLLRILTCIGSISTDTRLVELAMNLNCPAGPVDRRACSCVCSRRASRHHFNLIWHACMQAAAPKGQPQQRPTLGIAAIAGVPHFQCEPATSAACHEIVQWLCCLTWMSPNTPCSIHRQAAARLTVGMHLRVKSRHDASREHDLHMKPLCPHQGMALSSS